NLLAFAFEGALGREDLLGEVLGRVGFRRSEPRRGVGRADRRRALEAELRPAGQLCAAVGAPESQRRRALQAELRLGRVLLLAPGTLHPSPHEPGRRRSGRWEELSSLAQ